MAERSTIDFEWAIGAALQQAHDPDSHVERDPDTFHPSQLAFCERQCYLSKLGLKDDSEILGVFQTGTLIHEFLEEFFRDDLWAGNDSLAFEESVDNVDPMSGIHLTGRADCVDYENGAVYDFKTRNGWYNFDPPVDRHLDQLHLYMACLPGVDEAQVVYLSKGDMEVRTWPEEGAFSFDPGRYTDLIAKAETVRQAIREDGIAKTAAEIPFGDCGCFFCDSETLRFEGGDDDA